MGSTSHWAVRGFLSALIIFGQSVNQRLSAQPADEAGTTRELRLPGYDTKVAGRWLPATESRSGVALGGLGTGFIELRPDGRIYDAVLQNNWLKPVSPAACGLDVLAGGARAVLVSSSTSAVVAP